MRTMHRKPVVWALGLAFATLAAAVYGEQAKPEAVAPMADHTCKMMHDHAGPQGQKHVEPAAPMPGGNGKGEPQTGPSGGPPSPGGAPPPAAAADTPHVHLTLSGSDRAAAMPCATGTLPADPSIAKQKATKTRSNIQNN